MSRILAQSVTADLLGRFLNRLLLVILFPFILILAVLPVRRDAAPPPVPVRSARPPARRSMVTQGDLKTRP